ncbi:MAG: hypothetical protein ACE5FS_12675 [Paracoccaceae bacterium]
MGGFLRVDQASFVVAAFTVDQDCGAIRFETWQHLGFSIREIMDQNATAFSILGIAESRPEPGKSAGALP